MHVRSTSAQSDLIGAAEPMSIEAVLTGQIAANNHHFGVTAPASAGRTSPGQAW
jgi:hypothetical protein